MMVAASWARRGGEDSIALSKEGGGSEGVNLMMLHSHWSESALSNELTIIEGMSKACRYSAEERKERICRYRSKRSQRYFNKGIKILHHMEYSVKENSLPFQVMSRAREYIIKQHGHEIEDFEHKKMLLLKDSNVSEKAQVSEESAPNSYILDRSEINLQLQSSNCGQNTDQAFAFDISSLWAMEQGGSKLVSTCEDEITQVNGCAEQNVGVMRPPRNESSLFGARIGSSQVGGVRQADSSPQQPAKENDIAKQNIGARSPRIGSSRVIARQADQSSQQSINHTNRGNVVIGELDEATGSRKQGKVRTLDIEYGISLEVLERHSGKKLDDVAVTLGVSRSTLKRICRKHNIFRWPPFKAKKRNYCELVQVTHASAEESSQRTQPVSDLPPEKESTSKVETKMSAKPMRDDSSIMVKATYNDDIIKFQLLVSARKLDLEKEVAMRLNLSVGSFKIKYLDEDDDWVLIACDADLRTCISTLTSSSAKTTIKMLID